jgi:subtilisin family serine protease
MTSPVFTLIAAALMLVAHASLPLDLAGGGLSAVAWADDDDDGGDDGSDDRGDDDDDDDGGGFSGGGRDDDDDDGSARRPSGGSPGELGRFIEGLFGGVREPAPAAPAPAPAPPPPRFAPDEIVTLGLSVADLDVLIAEGFVVIEERPLLQFGTVSRRLSIPQTLSLEEARQFARALPSGQDADFNHYYRSEQGFSEDCRGAECPARLMLDWPLFERRDEACGQGVAIGMIDTGINADHETFAGASLTVRQLAPGTLDPSRAIHGTAVAALLVGDPATRSPGLVPAARLIALDAFHRVGGDERADVFTLIEALGELAAEEVGVINLSLAGPDNSVLAEIVERLVVDQDIVLAAAVGNDGPAADPTYPSAYDPVLAVTAVDRAGNIYRRAVRGPHVDLAAPGVNIWTAASISGARWKTGTSFAVPFVSAAAAILRAARPDLTALEVGDELRRLATDIGEPGPDTIFGAGLLDIRSLCNGAT